MHTVVKASQNSTQKQVFTQDGEPETIQPNTTNPNSMVYDQQGKTYSEFMDQQNPIIAVGAAIGNTLTGDLLAGYGDWAADQTLSSVAKAHNVSEATVAQNFANLDGAQQILVSLGQALTAPLGGGGAAGWGATVGSWLGW